MLSYRLLSAPVKARRPSNTAYGRTVSVPFVTSSVEGNNDATPHKPTLHHSLSRQLQPTVDSGLTVSTDHLVCMCMGS